MINRNPMSPLIRVTNDGRVTVFLSLAHPSPKSDIMRKCARCGALLTEADESPRVCNDCRRIISPYMYYEEKSPPNNSEVKKSL